MTRQRGTTARNTAIRVIPLVLLIILAMAGLRGNVIRPKWTGSHGADIAIGAILFVTFAVLLGITMARRRAVLRAASEAEDGLDPQGKLRVALIFVLSLAMVADVSAILFALHLKLPKPKVRRNALHQQAGNPPRVPKVHGHDTGGGGSFPVTDVLWGLLVILLIAVIVLTMRWLAQQTRIHDRPADDDLIAEDSATLREAVESGRTALRTFDDAKSAIIACYAAMEHSLAEHGAARAASDTPDELLARATRKGVVHGTAPARLTALFYEARFSSHPMDQDQRQAAEQALNDLAQALDSQRHEPQGAGT
jgi:hypothetical protein